jgi:hypothetical protein
VSGDEAARRQGGVVVVGGARWGRTPMRERRRVGEGLVRCRILRGLSAGGFYRGQGGGERPGEAEKWPAR